MKEGLSGVPGLARYAEANHGSFRSRSQVLATVATAVLVGGLAALPAIRPMTRVAPLELAACFSTFIVVFLAAVWVHRRHGFESRAYQAVNALETAVTVLGSHFLIFRSGSAVSFFWVFYFAVVGQSAGFGANVLFNTVLYAGAPCGLALAFLLSGDSASAALTAAMALVSVAGYRLTLGATRHTARAIEDRRRLALQERELTVLRERERIGRDLHDGMGGELTSLVYRVQALELRQEERDELAGRLHDVLEGLRSVVWMLRQERRTIGEVVAWLRTRCGELGSGDVRVRLVAEADEQLVLPGELGMHVVLVVLEAVRNAIRHSGAAAVTVRLLVGSGRLDLHVQDDGKGLPAGSEGLLTGGLANLRSRAETLGGALTVASGAEGTTVSFSCPLPPEE